MNVSLALISEDMGATELAMVDMEGLELFALVEVSAEDAFFIELMVLICGTDPVDCFFDHNKIRNYIIAQLVTCWGVVLRSRMDLLGLGIFLF